MYIVTVVLSCTSVVTYPDALSFPPAPVISQLSSTEGHLVHETAIENTYEQVTLPNKAKLDSASFPSQQRDHSQYDYITNNSVFHSE